MTLIGFRGRDGLFSKLAVRWSAVALAGLLSVSAAAVGCTAAIGDAEEASGERTAEGEAHPRFEHQLAQTLAELELTPEQRKGADRIVEDLAAALTPVHEAKSAAAKQLAAEVRTGSIDSETMNAKIDELKAALSTAKPKWQAAANQLHATLSEDQREALVEAFQDRFEDRRSNRRGRMEQIAEELQLTDDQRDQIKEAFHAELKGNRRAHARSRMRAMRNRVEEMVEAFESDDFDAETLDLGGQALDAMDQGAKVMVRATEIALETLDANQRERLAKIIELRFAG